jgi:type I restriction enzyme, S subunit
MSSRAAKDVKTFRFDQIATLINDRVDDPAESGVERYVGLEHLDAGSQRIRRWGEVTDVESTKLRFQPGDIIFGKRRVYQRKLAVADFEGICSAHAMVLRANANVVLPEFLPYFMEDDHFMERALQISVGSLSPTINWKALAGEEFSLPSLQEQRRMLVALSAARDAVESYEALNAAIDPALTSHFAHVIRGETAFLPGHLRGAVDVGLWSPRTIGSLCQLGSGHGFTPSDWSERGMPIIRIQNVRGSAAFNYFGGVPDPRWIVEPGELLFAWAGVPGVSFGPGIWRGPRALLNQHIYRVTPHPGIDRDWLYEVLVYLTPLIERRAHGFKSSLLHIRKEEFTSQQILVPPSDQQLLLAKWINASREIQRSIEVRRSSIRNIYSKLLSETVGVA